MTHEIETRNDSSGITATFTGPRRKSLFPKAARPAAPCATYCYHAIVTPEETRQKLCLHNSIYYLVVGASFTQYSIVRRYASWISDKGSERTSATASRTSVRPNCFTTYQGSSSILMNQSDVAIFRTTSTHLRGHFGLSSRRKVAASSAGASFGYQTPEQTVNQKVWNRASLGAGGAVRRAFH